MPSYHYITCYYATWYCLFITRFISVTFDREQSHHYILGSSLKETKSLY